MRTHKKKTFKKCEKIKSALQQTGKGPIRAVNQELFSLEGWGSSAWMMLCDEEAERKDESDTCQYRAGGNGKGGGLETGLNESTKEILEPGAESTN